MESPVMGWLIPYEWQEPDHGNDLEPETESYPPDCDSEGYLIPEM